MVYLGQKQSKFMLQLAFIALFHVNFPLNKQKHILSSLQTLINHKHRFSQNSQCCFYRFYRIPQKSLLNLHCFKKDTLAKETLNRLSFLFDNKFCILDKGNQLKKANFVVFTYCEEFDESCTFLKGYFQYRNKPRVFVLCRNCF